MDLGAMRLAARHLEQQPEGVPWVNVTATHVQFNCLLVASACPSGGAEEGAVSPCLAALARRVAAAAVSAAAEDDAAGFTRLTVSALIENGPFPSAKPLLLEVVRNLTCSELGGFANQTSHTQWNCLLDRRVDGTSITPPVQLEVNGGAVAPPLFDEDSVRSTWKIRA